MSDARRPVTVVTGFLGSGKTTLVRRLLLTPGHEGSAVVVNELGEVGLDHHLVRVTQERTVLVGGGCACCGAREDLVQALLGLLAAEAPGRPLPGVLLETTGLADPGPVLYTLRHHPVLRHHLRLREVVTTVDAVAGPATLAAHAESVRQVAAADRVVLTKGERVDPAVLAALAVRVRALNPAAALAAEPPVHDLPPPLAPAAPAGGPGPASEPGGHLGDVETVALELDRPLPWAAFAVWLSLLLHRHGERVLRVKGLLDVGEPGPVLLEGVQHVVEPAVHLASWPDGDRRSRLVLVLRGLAAADVRASLAALVSRSA